MSGEFPDNNGSEFQAQPGGLLEQTRQVAAAQAVAETAPIAEPEIQKSGLMEHIDGVSKRQDAELTPELSDKIEAVEATPEINQLIVEKLSKLQQRINRIPVELGAQEYQYEVRKTIHNLIQEVASEQPSKPSPSAELFK